MKKPRFFRALLSRAFSTRAFSTLAWLGVGVLPCSLGSPAAGQPAAVQPAASEAARPRPGQFAPLDQAVYLSGELVVVDPINRRGGMRVDGDANGRYHDGPLHYFAMLPYGVARLHGAPAELRDIPLGTRLHGYFHLPPVGDEDTIPPLPPEQRKHQIPHNHALSLADDFSHHADRGRAWKVVALDRVRGKLEVAPTGALAQGGDGEKQAFDIDPVARVWKQRSLVELDAIEPGQVVQLNLAWAQGARDKEFSVADIWLDDESRGCATELQRRRHVRYQRPRWLPGWIDHVEHFDYGGGVVTLTLFGGMDPSLYADLKETRETGFWVAAADKTLRTWFHRGDRKVGKVLEWSETADPPLGSGGVQLKLKFAELLEGYRPGRCVRVKCERWAFVTMPPEERLKSLDDLKRSATLTLP